MADETDDEDLFRRKMEAPQPVEYLTHEELERHRRLIRAEPALSRLAALEPDITARAKRDTAFALVGEITKKAAAWIAGMIGTLFLLSELLQRIAK